MAEAAERVPLEKGVFALARRGTFSWRPAAGWVADAELGLIFQLHGLACLRWLRQGGFTVAVLYSFHSLESIFWGYAFRLMERLGRGDLADRCPLQMGTGCVVSGRQAL